MLVSLANGKELEGLMGEIGAGKIKVHVSVFRAGAGLGGRASCRSRIKEQAAACWWCPANRAGMGVAGTRQQASTHDSSVHACDCNFCM